MRRLWRGFSRWSERDEMSGPLAVATLIVTPVALVTGNANAYGTLVVFSLLAIVERAWGLGA